jgi:serine/threonine-protein kinase RsbW
VTEDLSAVRLELVSRPEAPALVRAVLTGVAQSMVLESELFDDLKTAVSEACNNAVLHAYGGRPGPLVFGLEVGPDAIEATIRDWGSGIQHVGPSDERMGVGLAVISALADRAEFISAPDGGTEVRMSFARRGQVSGSPPGRRDLELQTTSAPVQLSGDVVATVTPVGLLAGVLGRLARAVAGRTHLSLDRFSDIYLVADAITALAESAAVATAVSFSVTADDKRLELTVGPFGEGTGARVLEHGWADPAQSALGAPLLAELASERRDGNELLRVVIDDAPGRR